MAFDASRIDPNDANTLHIQTHIGRLEGPCPAKKRKQCRQSGVAYSSRNTHGVVVQRPAKAVGPRCFHVAGNGNGYECDMVGNADMAMMFAEFHEFDASFKKRTIQMSVEKGYR